MNTSEGCKDRADVEPLYESLLDLAAKFIRTDRREEVAREIAHHLGAEDLFLFLRDPVVAAHLPAPGLPQTLPESRKWHAFVAACAAGEPGVGELTARAGEPSKQARGIAVADGSVIVLLGGSPSPGALRAAGRTALLVAAAIEGERAAKNAVAQEQLARETAQRSSRLVETLDLLRRDLQVALTKAEAAQARALFLAESNSLLAASLDYETTLECIVQLAVPYLADYCLVDLDQGVYPVTRVGVREEGEQEIRTIDPLNDSIDPAIAASAHMLLATAFNEAGSSLVSGEIAREGLPDSAGHAGTLWRAGYRSYLAVRLAARQQQLGAALLLSRAERGRYGEDDTSLAHELARRAAVAVDNARLYRELERADRAKDEFLAMLAHELRNPLEPIVNAIALMRMRPIDGRGEEGTYPRALTVIERQVEHLARLVDDLLDVSRVVSGKITLSLRRIDLAVLLRAIADDFQPILQTAGLTLDLEVPEAAVPVIGDETRLSQVFGNLLQNARKFTEPGGRIAIELRHDADGAVVRVTDTGIGIERGLLPWIFEPFHQAEWSLHRTQGGLGLGLSLARGLIALHGGTVTAASEGLGLGSEFTVRLPIPIRAELEEDLLAEPTACGGTPSRGKTPCFVLVIEDNRDAVETLQSLLEMKNHRVEVATTGLEGVEKARALHPDLVLCDIGLPEMDGYTVARALRARPELKGMRMVALSGYGQPEDIARSMDAGFDRHLVKPVDPEGLLRLADAVADARGSGSG